MQELTQTLSLLLKEKQVKQSHQQQQRHTTVSPNMSRRARRIAQTAFDLSDAEVDDLLSDDTSTASHRVTMTTQGTWETCWLRVILSHVDHWSTISQGEEVTEGKGRKQFECIVL